MKCINQPTPYGLWRLQTLRQLFLTLLNSNVQRRTARRKFSSLRSSTSSKNTLHGEASNTADISTKVRESSCPSELLPQSPLLKYPRLVNPEKHEKRKKRPSPDDTADLRKNPWAMALISPVRICSVTRNRIPREFMSDWGFIQPKGTEELWFSPIGLMKHELAAVRSKQGDGEVLEDPTAQAQAQTQTLPSIRKPNQRPLKLRIIDRIPLIRLLNKPLSKGDFLKSKSPVAMLFPTRWKQLSGPVSAKEEKQIIWREDMPDFLLSRIRKMAMLKLTRAARLHKEIDASNGVWSAVEMGNSGDAREDLLKGVEQLALLERMGTGGVLVMGLEWKNSSAGDQACQSVSSQSMFPDYITLPKTQSKVPVFDLSVLFSEAEQEELKSSYPHFQKMAIFFRPDDTVTVQTMLALWKLKSALRELP